MNAAHARIILRYGIGLFVGLGVISADLGSTIASDPDMQMLVETALIGIPPLVVEGWYWLAKRFGWKT